MEPQEEFCYEKKHCNKKNCSCFEIIICILLALLLGSIGLIVGAVCAVTLLANLAVLISSTVIIGILLIITILYKICICSKGKR